jgi:hypothetical protein
MPVRPHEESEELFVRIPSPLKARALPESSLPATIGARPVCDRREPDYAVR